MNQGPGTALPFPSSLRASVERGDPFAVFRMFRAVELGSVTVAADGTFVSATTPEPKAHASQSVTTHPQTLDTQPDGDYGDAMSTHAVEFAPTGTTVEAIGAGAPGKTAPAPLDSGEKGSPENPVTSSDLPMTFDGGKTYWCEADRLAFLARAQRIDSRTRK